MIKGLYRSASAMLPRIKMQEITANNLANASAPGFKRDMLFTKELSAAKARQIPRKSDWETPMIDQVYTEYEQGMLEKTDNPLDLGLEGDGFFVLETDDGQTMLSRSGSFTVSPAGFLVSPEGHRVLGDGGPIAVGEGSITISESGQVEVDSNAIGTIRVANVEDKTALQKVGQSEFMIPEGVEPIAAVNYAIRQGYLESSNVNLIKEMVDMIISFRNYEADAQSLKTQDDSLEKLINNVGRVR
jgi:flagellar basal-body rod protein FlgF